MPVRKNNNNKAINSTLEREVMHLSPGRRDLTKHLANSSAIYGTDNSTGGP